MAESQHSTIGLYRHIADVEPDVIFQMRLLLADFGKETVK
jgi:hypothetical protein